ncbi:MAG: hypothetical protein J6Y19_09660, partial [Kiritimatiellae bacterium]|nr:hypothetical protein [Kiritimatiellia bacterium]
VTDPAGIREGGREAACRGKSVTLEVCEAHEDADGNGLCDLCGGLSGSVPYVVRGWDGSAGTESDAVCTNFTLYNGQTRLESGWYVVAGNVTNNSRLWVYGDVHLILCDGAVLTALNGINVDFGYSLTIYGQSGDSGMLFAGTDGTTDAWTDYTLTGSSQKAGIGGHGSSTCGEVTIHGGTVAAFGRYYSAGIGGGQGGDGGDVKIYGGTVLARGDDSAPAIGKGDGGYVYGKLTLGEMKVTEPAGTVAMRREDTCHVMLSTTVRLEPCRMHEFEDGKCKWCGAAFRPVPYVERGWDGGAVTEREAACTNFAYLAGQERLESGWYVVADNVVNNNRITVAGDVRVILCDRRTLTVPLGINVEGNNSLTVYGQGGDSGRLFAGTDGTTDADGNYIATCPDNCAGIGGNQVGDGGTVTVHGGTVVAAGDSRRGAGIGGGQDGYGGTLTVYGGTVAAQGGQYGAGIGGGDYGSGGKAAIYGGKVTATGGTDGAAIGAGAGSNLVDGELEIVGMRVTDPAGTLATNRVEACRAVGGSVTLEVCEPHEDGDGDGFCDYCGTFCGPVTYWDPVAGTNGVCTDYAFYAGGTTLTSGWWVVSGSVTNAGRIVVDGDVHLILMDGAELVAQKGVDVAVVEGVTNRLTVWAQSDGDGMGRLTATASEWDAGIGGNEEHSAACAITINGGF